MTLLDTNVLSEFMRPEPSAAVVVWLDAQDGEAVFISPVSRAEIELGLALLPEGKRQQALSAAARAMFEEDFAERCLPFDEKAASVSARIVAAHKHAGRPISFENAQIAAIALASGLRLATRNTSDFTDIDGLCVVNPWADATR